MNNTYRTAFGLLSAAFLLVSPAASRAAIALTDIRFWAGVPAGPDTNTAVLVLDFHDGSPGLAWGYRWPSGESRTGRDLLTAILGADTSLSVDSVFFPSSITYAGRSRSFFDNGTPANYLDDSYWGYWVNNDVFYHPTDFLQNSHIVPPANEVVPLGNPYTTGRWVESSTGAAARPLVNGSWDAWSWGVYGTQAGEPLPAVPEPATAALVILATAGLTVRRRPVSFTASRP